MAITYITQQLQIKIYIDKDDIDRTDIVNLYEDTDAEPSSGGELIATIKSQETDDDPSSTGDAYLFQHNKSVFTPGTYYFYYTISDQYGNESEVVSSFESEVCLTPQAPDAMAFSEIDFDGSTAIDASLSSSCVAQYKMNDNLGTTNVINEFGTDGTASVITHTLSRTNAKINKAFIFNGTSHYLSTGALPGPVYTDSFSMNIWVNPLDGQPILGRTILGVEGVGGSDYINLSLDSNGKVSFKYKESTSSVLTTTTPNTVFGAGFQDVYKMITITAEEVDTNTMRVKIYIDGVLEVTSADTAINMDIFTVAPLDMYLGAANLQGTDSLHFDGILDNYCLFSKVLTQTDIDVLYNSGNATEGFAWSGDEFYTISHYDTDTPGVIVEDGDYPTDATTFGLDLPVDSSYRYYRTVTDVDCSLESDNSGLTSVEIEGAVDFEIPLADATNIFITNTSGGRFFLNWNYNTDFSTDPIDEFRIYVDNDGDPSSGGNWVLEDTVNYFAGNSVYGYITQAQIDGTVVVYKIVPFATGGKERDTDVYVEGVADNAAPSVTNDFIETELI